MRFKTRRLAARAAQSRCGAGRRLLAAAARAAAQGGNNSNTGTVTVAVVSNPLITGQMVPLTKSVFEKQYPGIKVKFATYTEGDLRAAIEKDVSTHSNAFNVVMIGPYETPLFAKNGWLDNLSKQYIAKDPATTPVTCSRPSPSRCPTRATCTRCRSTASPRCSTTARTCSTAAGLTMPPHPTWTQVQTSAAKLNQPGKQRGSACAAWPAGATTWRRSTRSSTPSAASGST